MKIILINGSSTPLYEQIKNAIKENILENRLIPDEQLPSVRQLSRDLDVSILTVKKAYDDLEKEGYIIIRQGLGTFVASVNPELLTEEKQKEMEQNLIAACKIAKSIDIGKAELCDFLEYIYDGGPENG